MKNVLAIFVVMLLVAIALALWVIPERAVWGQATPTGFLEDPCFTAKPKLGKVISVTTAATTLLVELVSGQKVYVCGGYLSVASSATTAATAQFINATAAGCTGTTTGLTGTMGTGTATAGIDAEPVVLAGMGTQILTGSGNGLCLVTAGTTVNVQGYISYVQQ